MCICVRVCSYVWTCACTSVTRTRGHLDTLITSNQKLWTWRGEGNTQSNYEDFFFIYSNDILYMLYLYQILLPYCTNIPICFNKWKFPIIMKFEKTVVLASLLQVVKVKLSETEFLWSLPSNRCKVWKSKKKKKEIRCTKKFSICPCAAVCTNYIWNKFPLNKVYKLKFLRFRFYISYVVLLGLWFSWKYE